MANLFKSTSLFKATHTTRASPWVPRTRAGLDQIIIKYFFDRILGVSADGWQVGETVTWDTEVGDTEAVLRFRCQTESAKQCCATGRRVYGAGGLRRAGRRPGKSGAYAPRRRSLAGAAVLVTHPMRRHDLCCDVLIRYYSGITASRPRQISHGRCGHPRRRAA